MVPAGRMVIGGGSSPLTRGKLTVKTHSRSAQRLIPAHAGKTIAQCVPHVAAAAHPRSRGENALVIGVLKARGGSSPLTRGKRSRKGDKFRSMMAHPRSRGENVSVALTS